MKISYSLGSLLKIDDVMYCARRLGERPPDAVWIPETWGMECFGMIGALSQILPGSSIGSSIINVYSRSAAAIAMGAVTADTLLGGRLILGLGSSSRPIVEDLHGIPFENPVGRVRDYVRTIRDAISGAGMRRDRGETRTGGFSLLVRPPRERIPIYLAAVNRRMLGTAWDIADGIILYLRPPAEMRDTISRMQEGRRIETCIQIITAVSDDRRAAYTRAKKTLAFYVAVGSVYRDFLARHGYAAETAAIHARYEKSGLAKTDELVPDAMIDDLAICGTPDECTKKLSRFRDAGITMPILQFNPVGDVKESFDTLLETFSYGTTR